MKEQKNSSVTGSFTVEPRKRRKIKRSSFVYFTPKKSTGQSKTRGRQKKARKQVDDKTELLYCVCRKPDDGRKYWQCENCCNWFHPVCVGMKEDEEPWTYICKTCQDKQSKKETIKKKHDGGKKDTVKDSTDEEVVPVHEVTREEHDGGKKDTVKDSTDEEVVPVYEVTREEHDGGKDTVKDSTDEEVVPVQEVTSEAQDKEPEDFEPTPWFQPVKTGQKVPGGLYVKMDLKTGETLAKLVEGTKEYKRWEEKQRKVNVEKAVESEGSEEFEEFEGPDEKNFFVNKETAEKNIGAAFARLDKIIRLAESSEKWMKRHHIFRSSEGSAKVVWKGYGYAIFSVQAIQFMEAEVKRRYFTDVTSKIYSRHGRIVGMLDEKMNELFANDRFLAEIYLMDVLVTESLAAVLQESTGLSYRRVDMECKAVEGKSNVTALKAGLELSAKKKQELEEAMVS
ncbi:uncharacterized protein LOC128549099 [Mercenaria mercenaria]|uniref:uncharacterized protein LOC128549099 n=1 Tax=Mercenaria mercenaria TaxID=6596 RepID=UPI00234EAA7F|nr:uncharacterized protein LOC128549099 [Mercenaria mercenaria]